MVLSSFFSFICFAKVSLKNGVFDCCYFSHIPLFPTLNYHPFPQTYFLSVLNSIMVFFQEFFNVPILLISLYQYIFSLPTSSMYRVPSGCGQSCLSTSSSHPTTVAIPFWFSFCFFSFFLFFFIFLHLFFFSFIFSNIIFLFLYSFFFIFLPFFSSFLSSV